MNNQQMSQNKSKKKGEVYDLQVLLKKAIKKTNKRELNELLKKVITYMTWGVDVSILFTDMCLLSQFDDLLSKKMIYLYLGTYAEVNPQLALLAVNTFLKELQNKGYKIRGLALRSLCQLKSQYSSTKTHIVDMLKDQSNYVKNIAIMGCLKIHHEDPNFFEDFELHNRFYGLLKNPSPFVVISVINVLNEVYGGSGMPINSKIITYLLNRFHEFNDYGKSVIVDLAMQYQPKDNDEKIKIMNLLDSNFKSTDSNLVISLIKLFLKYNLEDEEFFQQVLERVKDSLLTLLITAEKELKYSLLHHILEFIKLGGGKFFEGDFKRFFCDFEEKIFIQKIKLEILKNLISDETFDQIFNELSLYINPLTPELAKQSIKIMGGLGQNFSERIPAIVSLFKKILENHQEFQESILIALKPIFSKNLIGPHEKKIILEEMGNYLENLNSEEGKVCFMWFLMKFCEEIKHCGYMIGRFVNEYKKQQKSLNYKLQLINSIVCIFLANPKETLPILSNFYQEVFKNENESFLVTQKCKIYYSLMAQDVKKLEKYLTQFCDEAQNLQDEEAARSFGFLNTLEVIFHKPQDQFIKKKDFFMNQRKKGKVEEVEESEEEIDEEINEESNQDQQPEQEDINFLEQAIDSEELGIVDVNLEETCSAFKCQDSELAPNEFMGLWGKFQKSTEMDITLDQDIQDKDVIVKIFEDVNINCIASQSQNKEYKFYFYCKPLNTNEFILFQLNVKDGDEVFVTFKAQSEDQIGNLMNEIEKLFKENNYLE